MKILGIDPGTTRIGYGLIESSGGDLLALNYGLLDITGKNDSEKLLSAGETFKKLLEKTKPDLVAIEELFFTKNQKTAMAVAGARGVLKFIALQKGYTVREYGPGEVKLAVTSYGASDKKAVTEMTKRILKLKSIAGPDDVADALAIAITAASRAKIDDLNEV